MFDLYQFNSGDRGVINVWRGVLVSSCTTWRQGTNSLSSHNLLV